MFLHLQKLYLKFNNTYFEEKLSSDLRNGNSGNNLNKYHKNDESVLINAEGPMMDQN